MTDKITLERISLSGYKSIRELENFKLCSDLNILIGANGSGKTNFIRFFELLSHMMDPNKGLQNYVSARGRADAFLFRGMKVTPELKAHLVFGRNEYKFTLRAADDRSLFFAQESAPFDGPVYGPIENDQGSGHIESKIAMANRRSRSEKWVVETIQGWRVYHFHDTSPSAPMMGTRNTIDNDILLENAANLAPFLLRMSKSNPEVYAQIVEVVRQVAPFFGDFVLRDESGQTQLLWRDRYSDLVYYPYQLSDGTIRFVCLATLLLQPNPVSTLIIDEPELGLHPYAVQLLASLLYEASSRAQLIVSTQSSMLLDEFSPDKVIVVDHQNGETVFSRLDPERLEGWLEEYTLGQLWEKNELGGAP